MALEFPDIDPIAVSFGPFAVHWYALAYVVGILLGWYYVRRISTLDDEKYISHDTIDDFVPWAILGIILGGRIGYVLFYQTAMFWEAPLDIFKVWQGGMSFHGGAAGTIIAMVVYSWCKKLPVLRLTDMVVCAVPIGLFLGRIANFINGELFGRVTDVPWGIVFPNGGDLPRHPSQIYEAGLEGVVLGSVLAILIHVSSVRGRPGVVSGVFLAGYGLARFTVEFVREPDSQLGYLAGGLTMGQYLSLPLLICGTGLAAWAMTRNRPHENKAA